MKRSLGEARELYILIDYYHTWRRSWRPSLSAATSNSLSPLYARPFCSHSFEWFRWSRPCAQNVWLRQRVKSSIEFVWFVACIHLVRRSSVRGWTETYYNPDETTFERICCRTNGILIIFTHFMVRCAVVNRNVRTIRQIAIAMNVNNVFHTIRNVVGLSVWRVLHPALLQQQEMMTPKCVWEMFNACCLIFRQQCDWHRLQNIVRKIHVNGFTARPSREY